MAAEAEAAREARAKVILSTKTQHINNHQKGKAVFCRNGLTKIITDYYRCIYNLVKSIYNL